MNWLSFYFSRLQQLKGCLLFTERVWAALGTLGAGLVSRWAHNWDTSDSTLPIQRHPRSLAAWGKAGEEPFCSRNCGLLSREEACRPLSCGSELRTSPGGPRTWSSTSLCCPLRSGA